MKTFTILSLIFFMIIINSCKEKNDITYLNENNFQNVHYKIIAKTNNSKISKDDISKKINQEFENYKNIFLSSNLNSEISLFNQTDNLDWFYLSNEIVGILSIIQPLYKISFGVNNFDVFVNAKQNAEIPLILRKQPTSIKKMEKTLKLKMDGLGLSLLVDKISGLFFQNNINEFSIQLEVFPLKITKSIGKNSQNQNIEIELGTTKKMVLNGDCVVQTTFQPNDPSSSIAIVGTECLPSLVYLQFLKKFSIKEALTWAEKEKLSFYMTLKTNGVESEFIAPILRKDLKIKE